MPSDSALKAVFFDLDDTLCGYWDASKAALRKTFELHAPEGVAPEDMYEHWAEAFREFAPTLKRAGWYDTYLTSGKVTRTEQMRLTLLRAGVDDLNHAERLSQSYMEHRDQNLRLFPDAIEVLDALRATHQLGLMTNGPADIQRQEVATLGIGHYFDPILIEGEMRFGKPDPRVHEIAQNAVGVEPSQIVMVGNSFGHDIVPSIRAGWRTVWIRRASDVPPSAKGPEQLGPNSPIPDATVESLTEAYDWIVANS